MSILIKGMKMPKDCGECFFYDEAHNWCEAKDNHLHNAKDETNRAIWCPLIEVPTPHGRLVDADKIPERYVEVRDLAPTVIEAEKE